MKSRVLDFCWIASNAQASLCLEVCPLLSLRGSLAIKTHLRYARFAARCPGIAQESLEAACPRGKLLKRFLQQKRKHHSRHSRAATGSCGGSNLASFVKTCCCLLRRFLLGLKSGYFSGSCIVMPPRVSKRKEWNWRCFDSPVQERSFAKFYDDGRVTAP